MPISKHKKKLLCLFHNMMCEDCKKLNDKNKYKLHELEIHKINSELGYKDFRNLKVLCKKHHKTYSSAQRISRGIQGI